MFRYLNALFWRSWLNKRSVKFSGDLRSLRKKSMLQVEEGVTVGQVTLNFRELKIGAMSYIRSGGELGNISQIGRFCSIGNDVVLGQDKAAHPLHWVSTHPFQFTDHRLTYEADLAPAEIGHDVWIGRDAMVMEGVRVGTGAVIAARSVVTRDVPPYGIVAGVPARLIKFRHPPEVVAGLLDSAWWDRPLAALMEMPLAQPEDFILIARQANPVQAVVYRSVVLTRQGCHELNEGQVNVKNSR
ncbi:CatB-related O-acetyltransferase [Pseudomonas guineae]|uniref:CatB-related O-acetyltransferase n=1 Tax=Pseudomonas guineae TaxID=425504 RepID=UPI003D0776BD